MRNETAERTLTLDVVLPGSGVLDAILRLPHLALTVLRGRVAPGRSWFRLEVRGRKAELRKALNLLRTAAVCA